MISLFRKSEFFRSVVTLMTGTVAAQVIAFGVNPILTRFFYNDEDMGELGIYTRFVAFIAAFATARYDFAMPVTKHDHHAFSLFRLSLRIAFVCLFSVLIFGMCYALFQPQPEDYLLFVLMSVGSAYGTVWISVGTNWAIRKKEFRTISTQKIVNALSVSGFKVLFGFFHMGALGLLLGTFIGTVSSSLVYVKRFLGLKKEHKSHSGNKRMNVLAKEYKYFPIVSLPHGLLDLGIDSIMAWSIVYFYSKGTFGQYNLAFMMMKAPLAIIGQSIGQVFFNRASEMLNDGRSVHELMRRTVGILFLLSIVPFTVMYFWGSEVFVFVFGKDWRIAGRFAEILVPYLLFNFLLSPISSLPLVLGRQREAFTVGIVVAIIQLTSFIAIPYFVEDASIYQVLWLNSISLSVLLIAVYFLYLRFARLGRR